MLFLTYRRKHDMKKILCLFLIIGIAAVAVLASGCTDNSSGIKNNEGGDVPQGQDEQVNDTAALEPITSVYTEDNNTSSVRAVKGDIIIIMLEENPATGYSWNLSAGSGLSLLDEQYVQDSAVEGMAGAGGVHNWTFEVTENGAQNVSAIYKRSWENTTGNEDIFKLTVDVVPENTILRTKGTVVYVDIEGGFYGIAGEDNTNYDPVYLEDEFREDGLKVEFTAYPVEETASFHMWGRIIEIRSIQPVA
jgi:inhibitor of cysteine peptidase